MKTRSTSALRLATSAAMCLGSLVIVETASAGPIEPVGTCAPGGTIHIRVGPARNGRHGARCPDALGPSVGLAPGGSVSYR